MPEMDRRKFLLGALAAAGVGPVLPDPGVALASLAHPLGAPVTGDLTEAALEEIIVKLREEVFQVSGWDAYGNYTTEIVRIMMPEGGSKGLVLKPITAEQFYCHAEDA